MKLDIVLNTRQNYLDIKSKGIVSLVLSGLGFV
jgi:hypothetical protein